MTTPDPASSPSSPSTPPPGQQERSRTALIVFLLLLLAAAVGVACFFIGRSSADTSGKESQAAADVRAEYKPGRPGYDAIYHKGKAAGIKVGVKTGQQQGQATGEQQGKQVGLQQGTAQGQAQGDATGVKNGANAALGGFSSWNTNELYIVNIDNGQGNVPFAITSRQPMQEGVSYSLCQNDPQNLCQTAASGG
jgi:hypothetical protein